MVDNTVLKKKKMSNNIQVSQQFEPSTVTFSQLKKNKNGYLL